MRHICVPRCGACPSVPHSVPHVPASPSVPPGNRLESDASWTYSYDDEGNVTGKASKTSAENWTYQYDDKNRLTRVEKRATAGGPVSAWETYEYDALGNRIGVNSSESGEIRYAYDGPNVWADIDPSASASNALKVRYLTGDAVDQVFAREDANHNQAWYLTDHQGSVIDILDAQGNTPRRLRFDGYGQASGFAVEYGIDEASKAAIRNDRFGYLGRPRDRLTGMQIIDGRPYDPTAGRFAAQPQSGEDKGESNSYQFSTNTLKFVTSVASRLGVPFVGMVGLFTPPDPSESFWTEAIGVGDGVSFGLTSWARQKMGIDDVVDYNSSSYQLGNMEGRLLTTVILALAGSPAAASSSMAFNSAGAVAGAGESGWSTYMTTGDAGAAAFDATLGGIMGYANPRAAISSAIGTAGGYALGRYTGDGSSALKYSRWGGLLGGMGGDLFGGKSLGSRGRQLLWDAGGAVAGGGLAYMRGGDVLAGAQYGMMAASLTKQFACFAAGTPLLTPEGSKPIDELRVGDYVLSRHEDQPDGPVMAKRVEEVFVRRAVIIELVIGDRVIRTTAEHPFFVPGRGWTPAAELGPGVALVGGDGEVHVVEDIRLIEEPATVYNLSVADFHTYFVGCDEWGFSVWAHNAYEGLPDPDDHVLFRRLLDEHDYKVIGGKIFKNGQEIDGIHTETLSRLYKQTLGREVAPTINRIGLADPSAPVQVTVMRRSDPTQVKSVEKVRVTHTNDGSVHEDRGGKVADTLKRDGVEEIGYWTEWVHLPTRQVGEVSNPGGHRIITGQNGEVLYTTDHYKTYIPLADDYEAWSIFTR